MTDNVYRLSYYLATISYIHLTTLINVLFFPSENDPPELSLSSQGRHYMNDAYHAYVHVTLGELLSVKAKCVDSDPNQNLIINHTGKKGNYNADTSTFTYTVNDDSPLSAS